MKQRRRQLARFHRRIERLGKNMFVAATYAAISRASYERGHADGVDAAEAAAEELRAEEQKQ